MDRFRIGGVDSQQSRQQVMAPGQAVAGTLHQDQRDGETLEGGDGLGLGRLLLGDCFDQRPMIYGFPLISLQDGGPIR